ncbi:hypothetical protein [Agrobacterium sp. CG674]
MKAEENILDALCEAALEHEFFPESNITKRHFEGTHGKSATHDLLIETRSGGTYKITAELQPENGDMRTAGYR